MSLRVLELFCGIGGCAAALGNRAEVVVAIDIDRTALEVYSQNFKHPIENRTIESLSASDYRRWNADLWWLSPPCQPFTSRGERRDLEDPRSAALLSILDRIDQIRPPRVALENVPGFVGSQAHGKLLSTLESAGYAIREWELCPTNWGIANRRRRYYLSASRDQVQALPPPEIAPLRLGEVVQSPTDDLQVSATDWQRYRTAISVVDAADPLAVTSCFTSAYGRSPIRSGSYLATESGIRRFAPEEILRFLGFPRRYVLPAECSLRSRWRLAGNSLSIPAVRTVLAALAV